MTCQRIDGSESSSHDMTVVPGPAACESALLASMAASTIRSPYAAWCVMHMISYLMPSGSLKKSA